MRFLLIIALLASPVAAEARPWKRIVFHAAVGATAYVHWEGGRICRRNNGVEPCTAHYGEFRGTEIAQEIFTGSMITLSEVGHRNKYKEWFVPELGAGLFNTWWGIHEARIHVTKTDTH